MNELSNKLWTPGEDEIIKSHLQNFTNHIQSKYQLHFPSYDELWKWSVDEIDLFWKEILEYFEVQYSGHYSQVRNESPMPYTKWFEGISLNYAEHIFRKKTSKFPAIISLTETQEAKYLNWDQLEQSCARLQNYLFEFGMRKSDRIAAYLPNISEASIGLLTSMSMGCIWSSCSPDFGVSSVVDRFQQIEPKVLLAVDGYTYGGKTFDSRENVKEITQKIPSIQLVIWISNLGYEFVSEGMNVGWNEIMKIDAADSLCFERVPFDHPIWILYSSGTTGLPKAITHSQGGMLLEHLKYLHLQNDVHEGERFFWYSTTGWMMWNFVHASMLAGATAVLYDGSAAFPHLDFIWSLAEHLGLQHLGTSAPYIVACMKAQLAISEKFPLTQLRSIGSTGSPLPPEAFDYIYQQVHKEVWLCSMSGGTDVCTAFVGSAINKPVYKSEIQARALGVDLHAWDEDGNSVIGQVGEMVITKALPCMPVYFWKDQNYSRYRASYFEMYPDVWLHGDWVEITGHGGVIIYGRSDATLNRHGVRIGTAEIYNVINQFSEIRDAIVINLELSNGDHFMPLFIAMNQGEFLSNELIDRLKKALRSQYSPRHVPDEWVVVPDIPYTISGKKMESPVKKVLLRKDLSKAYNADAMRNPDSMDFFKQYAKEKAFEV